MTDDYAKGRADALRDAAAYVRNFGYEEGARSLLFELLSNGIEALAQQPQNEPKRECGTCANGPVNLCPRYLNTCVPAKKYQEWQPKGGA